MLLVVGGWLLAAGVAALLGVLAVYLLGSGIVAGTGKVLGADDVQRELARSGSPGTTGPPAAPSSPLAPPSSTEPPASRDDSNSDTDEPNGGQADARLQTVDTPGGTIIARCRGAKTELVSWTPRQGFEADDEVSDPEGAVYLEFSGSDVKVHVALGCSEGTLVPLVVTGDD